MRNILARPFILSVEAVSMIAVIMRHVHGLGFVEILAVMVSRDLVIGVPLNFLV